MVTNLHLDHPRDVRQIDLIRKTFGDAVLVIIDFGGNSIVFADKGGAVNSLRANFPHPSEMNALYTSRLPRAAFACVDEALTTPG